jgi:hypothetical protein
MEEVGAVKGSAGFGIALLLIAVAAGLLFDSGSVQRIAYDDGHAVLPAAVPLGQSRPVTASLTIRLVRGERFASFDDLVGDQQAAGYVKIDAFGDNWPATVTEIATDRDEIKFIRQDGTQHHFTKFDGYEMKMVRLRAGNKESILVFRSLNKRS